MAVFIDFQNPHPESFIPDVDRARAVGIVTNGGQVEDKVLLYRELPKFYAKDDKTGNELIVGPTLVKSFNVDYMRPHPDDCDECRGVHKLFFEAEKRPDNPAIDEILRENNYISTPSYWLNERFTDTYDKDSESMILDDYRCPECGASLWASNHSYPALKGGYAFAYGVPILDAHVYAPMTKDMYSGKTYCAHCLMQGKWTLTGIYITRYADKVPDPVRGELADYEPVKKFYEEFVLSEATEALHAVDFIEKKKIEEIDNRVKRRFGGSYFKAQKDALGLGLFYWRHDSPKAKIKKAHRDAEWKKRCIKMEIEHLLGSDDPKSSFVGLIELIINRGAPYGEARQCGLYLNDGLKNFITPYKCLKDHVETLKEKEVRAKEAEKDKY